MDLIIEARAWVQGALRDVEIGIQDGRIKAVKHDLPGSPRKRYRGQLLFPSGVDWHVHFRDPGAPHKEDFRTGTLAAAFGGTTTVIDFCLTNKGVPLKEAIETWHAKSKEKAVIDYGFHLMIGKLMIRF